MPIGPDRLRNLVEKRARLAGSLGTAGSLTLYLYRITGGCVVEGMAA